MIKQFFDRRGEKRSLSRAKTRLFNEVYRKIAKSACKFIFFSFLRNDEKINVQILAKRFFEIQVKKRRLSGAKTSIFNEVDRKILKVKMNSYFRIIPKKRLFNKVKEKKNLYNS